VELALRKLEAAQEVATAAVRAMGAGGSPRVLGTVAHSIGGRAEPRGSAGPNLDGPNVDGPNVDGPNVDGPNLDWTSSERVRSGRALAPHDTMDTVGGARAAVGEARAAVGEAGAAVGAVEGVQAEAEAAEADVQAMAADAGTMVVEAGATEARAEATAGAAAVAEAEAAVAEARATSSVAHGGRAKTRPMAPFPAVVVGTVLTSAGAVVASASATLPTDTGRAGAVCSAGAISAANALRFRIAMQTWGEQGRCLQQRRFRLGMQRRAWPAS
jgi:hypothetical protein